MGYPVMVRYGKLAEEVDDELSKAQSKFPKFNSFHEGKAVIEEEFDELWDEIKKKYPDKAKIRAEAIQLAAMALRFIIDTVDTE